MKVVHVGPVSGPHTTLLRLLVRAYPEENVIEFLPGEIQAGRSAFRSRSGFVRRVLRRHRPVDLLVVHWDRGISLGVRATWPSARKVVVHRYGDAPLKAGSYKRSMYKRVAGYVVDTEPAKKIMEVLARSDESVQIYQPPVAVPDGKRYGKPVDERAFFIGVPSLAHAPKRSLRDVNPALHLLAAGEHRFIALEDLGFAGTHLRYLVMDWETMLHTADMFVFLAESGQTYHPKLRQALMTGKPCVAPEQPVLGGLPGVEWYPRIVPNFLADIVNRHQQNPTTASVDPFGQPLSELMNLYRDFAP